MELFRQNAIKSIDCGSFRQPRTDAGGLFPSFRRIRAADLKAELLQYDAIQIVASLCGVQIVGGQRRVKNEAVCRIALRQKLPHERLAVVRDLFDSAAEQS